MDLILDGQQKPNGIPICPPVPDETEAAPPSSHGVAPGLFASARVRLCARADTSNSPDRVARVAEGVSKALHAGEWTRRPSSPVDSLAALCHLADLAVPCLGTSPSSSRGRRFSEHDARRPSTFSRRSFPAVPSIESCIKQEEQWSGDSWSTTPVGPAPSPIGSFPSVHRVIHQGRLLAPSLPRGQQP